MSQDTSSERPGEPVQQGTGAEGFPHGSKYPLFVGAGMFFLGVGLAMWLPALLVGVPVILYGIGGWTWEYAIEEFEAGVVPEQKHQLLGFKSGYLAMMLVISGELIIFASLFVVWFYQKSVRGPFPPGDLPAPDLTLGVLLTVVMLAASIAIGLGRRAIVRGNRSRFNLGLGATLVLGLAFMGLLAFDWQTMLAGGLSWTTGPYGAAYFIITGTHAAHLVGGLALAGVVAYRAWGRGHFSENRHLMVATTEVYWHFLTFVSILVLAFVYFPTR